MNNDFYEQQRRMDAERARQAEQQQQAAARQADTQRQADARRADLQRQEDARRADAQRQAADRVYQQHQAEQRRQQQQAAEDRRQQEFRSELARQQAEQRQQQQRAEADARQRVDDQRRTRELEVQRRSEAQRQTDSQRQADDQRRAATDLAERQRRAAADRQFAADQADGARRRAAQQAAWTAEQQSGPHGRSVTAAPPTQPFASSPQPFPPSLPPPFESATLGSGATAPSHDGRAVRPHRTMVGVLAKAVAMAAGGTAGVAAAANLLAANVPAARPYVTAVRQPVVDAQSAGTVAAVCLAACVAGAIRTARRTPSAILYAALAPVAAGLAWEAWQRSDAASVVATVNGRLLIGLAAVLAGIVVRGSRGRPVPRLSWGPRAARGLVAAIAVLVVSSHAWVYLTGRPALPAAVSARVPAAAQPFVTALVGSPPPLPASDPAVTAVLGIWYDDDRPGDRLTFRPDGTHTSVLAATADPARDARTVGYGKWVAVAFHSAGAGRVSFEGHEIDRVTVLRAGGGALTLESAAGEVRHFHR